MVVKANSIVLSSLKKTQAIGNVKKNFILKNFELFSPLQYSLKSA